MKKYWSFSVFELIRSSGTLIPTIILLPFLVISPKSNEVYINGLFIISTIWLSISSRVFEFKNPIYNLCINDLTLEKEWQNNEIISLRFSTKKNGRILFSGVSINFHKFNREENFYFVRGLISLEYQKHLSKVIENFGFIKLYSSKPNRFNPFPQKNIITWINTNSALFHLIQEIEEVQKNKKLSRIEKQAISRTIEILHSSGGKFEIVNLYNNIAQKNLLCSEPWTIFLGLINDFLNEANIESKIVEFKPKTMTLDLNES